MCFFFNLKSWTVDRKGIVCLCGLYRLFCVSSFFFFLKSGLLLCFCGTAGGLLNMCGCDGACWIGIARTVGNSHSLLLFHSPASISRTEACKDMHAFSSVRVLRKRRVFINQSGENKNLPRPPSGGAHSKFPTIEPFSPLTFSKVPKGKGGFPKGTASCYRSPKEDDVYKDS